MLPGWTLQFKECDQPKKQTMCCHQVVKLDQDFGSSFSGILVSDDDHLRALWASFSEQVGLGTPTVIPPAVLSVKALSPCSRP